MNIEVNNNKYELIENYKDAFDLEEFLYKPHRHIFKHKYCIQTILKLFKV